ncbi:DUF5403 family protein [Kocuria sp.]|uniref:DUF5403 family protein n=1 Tax=Kocuria sp. TaxID=1871328 RepID=UPI0026DF517C|nr:DUF5403 family protein [Kocuria sp.]MDO5619273.1 DUF5403 family protein [Kocuria sp.]
MVELDRDVSVQAARMVGESAQFDKVVESRRARIVSLAPTHSGAFAQSIRTKRVAGKRGVQDRVIYSTDPGALAIEFGYVTKAGKPVPGHFAFTRGISG